MMFRSSLSFALLFNAGAAAAIVACGNSGADNTGTGATGAGATGGTMTAGGAGGAGGSAGKGTATGGVGGATGGVGGATGGAGGVGGATGGVGGATGGTAGLGAGGVTGGTAGVGTGGATGGTAGVGTGGASGSAGMPVGGSGGGGTGDCTVTPMATQSENIATVFNVSFTTTLAAPEMAQIDFGLDTTYGFTAPVDLKDAKTPLLGMKTMKTYHYKVTVSGGGKSCSSADQTVMTGPLMQGLPKPTITTNAADKLAGGFLVSEWYAGKQMAFILDKDNEFVWWFDPKTVNAQFGDITRVRMSYDGKSMWIAHGNVPSQTGRMVKVNMDGTGGQDLSSSFTGMNHDFTVLPDETIYFVAYSSGNCDDIKQYKGGQTTTVMNIGKAFTSGACHANAIEYSKEDDTLVVSELDHDAYVKIKRTGEVVWVLGGGSNNMFTGDAATWDNEHNLEMLGANKMLMFNNGSGSGSTAIELELDTTAKTATKKWFYTASPAIANVVMGDVQRLPNGNTLVTYSTQGVIHEVDANKMLLQSLSWGTGGALGYVIKRPTLYGAPPK